MRIIIIGCGSIGRRHAQNARALGADVVLCDVNELRMMEFGKSIGVSKYFTDFKEAAKFSGAKAAVVATPSNAHIAPARALISEGIHVLMEKPLCTSLSEAVAFRPVVKEANLVFMMAHTYRFRPEWIAIKNMLDGKPLGKVHSAEFMGGWHLPDWHVREDYRHEYAAQKQLGGGVLLTNLSHLLDVVAWLFGDIKKIRGARMRLGDLEIDVDDAVMCILQTVSGVAVNISEDFLNRCPRRQFRINAEHGYLEADFNRKTMSIWDGRKKRFHPDDHEATSLTNPRLRILEDGVAYEANPDVFPMSYSGNDGYLNELKYFMDIVSSPKQLLDLDIDAGIKVLEAIYANGIEDWIAGKKGL